MSRLIYTLCLCLIVSSLYAQDLPGQQNAKKWNWMVSVTATEFVMRNFPLTVERFIGDFTTVGATIAYRPATSNGGKEIRSVTSGLFGFYKYTHAFSDISDGIYFSLHTRRYLTRNILKQYLRAEVFYRNWHYKNKYAEFDHRGDFAATRNENTNIYGFKLLYGYTKLANIPSGKNYMITLGTHVGFGMRYKTWTYDSFNGYVGETYYSHHIEKDFEWFPSIHFGINLGLMLRSKMI